MSAKIARGSGDEGGGPGGGPGLATAQTAAQRTATVVDTDAVYWRTGLRSTMFRPMKKSTTVRLDADVLDWLKARGKGYQTRLNALLREAMRKDVS